MVSTGLGRLPPGGLRVLHNGRVGFTGLAWLAQKLEDLMIKGMEGSFNLKGANRIRHRADMVIMRIVWLFLQKLGVLFCGVLMIRAVRFRVCNSAPGFLKAPT